MNKNNLKKKKGKRERERLKEKWLWFLSGFCKLIQNDGVGLEWNMQ